jgi:hypothetical protein
MPEEQSSHLHSGGSLKSPSPKEVTILTAKFARKCIYEFRTDSNGTVLTEKSVTILILIINQPTKLINQLTT